MGSSRPDPPQRVQPTFGALLRQYRLAARLTQTELADRAGLSVQGLSALESGRRQTPYRHTVAQLAAALGLDREQITALEAALSRVRTPAGVSPAQGEHAPAGQALLQLVPAPPELRNNLPVPLTSFIGREREQQAVVAALEHARLVTLTGAGGSGKTRLALEVAGFLLNEYPDGIWLAELAALADPSLVPQTVAQVLGLQEQHQRTTMEVLVDHLKHRSVLLVVDNCEHLVGACAELTTTLLRGCPQLRLVATSREPLEVPGEVIYRVPSLSIPDLDRLPPAGGLAQYEAVQLFVERAQARRADFTLSSRNAQAVAQVCTRLDGMPLAIELAAARVGSLPVEAIAARLDDRFHLLTGGPRAALPRQQTLQATVAWSYDLLSAPEQTLFNRLAIFAGGFSLEAAEAVCAGGTVAAEAVLDLLTRLVDKSLVVTEGSAGDVERYHLLETLRQYGQECLPAGSETEDLKARHLGYYRALVEEAERTMHGPRRVAWIDRLIAEQMNIRQAFRWALDVGAAQEGTLLAGALIGLVALALGCLGAATRAQADTTLARACYEEKLAFWRDLGNQTGIAATLAELGALALQEGAHAQTALCLEGLAAVAITGGQLDRAARLYAAAARFRKGTSVLNVWDDRVARDRQVAAVRAALSDGVFAAAWAEGQAMTLEQVIAEALEAEPTAGDRDQ